MRFVFFFQAEDGIRDLIVTGVQTCALPILRLRPKVMTVSTIVAGLLPIMWSQRVGSEVIKPLATPVLGGMVSSLIHVLVVTPVIFLWLRERALRRGQSEAEEMQPAQATPSFPTSL